MIHSPLISGKTVKKQCGDMNCTSCFKRRYSLFEGLKMPALEILERARSSVHWKKGEVIYKEGCRPQGLLCLNEGKVKITKMGVHGNEQIIGLKKPVDFLGLKNLISEKQFQNTAVALEDCSVCVIESSAFFEVLEMDRSLSFRILKDLSNQVFDAEDRILNLTQKHLRARLADTLILLSNVFGFSEAQLLNVEMKRSDIASLSNMTPSNATRVLSSFDKEGLIELNHRKIAIKDLQSIRSISEIG